VRVLLWHVHGSWTTAFVQGEHEYFIPVLPDRGPDGRGRARTWSWPSSVREVTPREMRELELDAVILQRPHELRLAQEWLCRRPGAQLPAVYVEHNAPQGRIGEMRHPLAGRRELTLVHVTHFNELFWDAGGTPTRVIEHGIVDPGYRYTGELPRAAAVINEAPRRGRVTGTDLLGRIGGGTRIDLFGMDAGTLGGVENVPQQELHTEIARRRVYLHPLRWTSLGLSLIEAMQLGMPVVALATTEAPEAVPPQAGVISTKVEALTQAIQEFMSDPDRALRAGRAARAAALARYGLRRFLEDWNALLGEVAA
jgi:hypothetical protein